MPNITVRGVVLGVRSTDYDFRDDKGEQVKGTSHTLVLFDFGTSEVTEIKVPQDRLGLTSDLARGGEYSFAAGVFGRNNRAEFRLSAVQAEHGAMFVAADAVLA